MKISGIYIIINIINNKVYIGSSIDIKKRINRHYNDLRKNKHYNEYLQNSWNKYGEINFKYDILEEIMNSNDLISKEQYYIDNYKANNYSYGYNLCPYAYNSLGYRHSNETKSKMSNYRKLNGNKYAKYREEHWNWGNNTSIKTRNLMSSNHANFNGENSKLSKLNNADVLHIRHLYSLGTYTYKTLGEIFNVNKSTIGKIIKKERWKHI